MSDRFSILLEEKPKGLTKPKDRFASLLEEKPKVYQPFGEMKGIGLGPMRDEPGDTRTMRERLGYGKPEVHPIFKAIREMVAPTTPYTEKEAIQAYKEIPRTLENVGMRVLTLGGLAAPLMGLKPSELRAALNEDIRDSAGFAPALAPALGETTLLAVEWGYLYPKLFKAVGVAPRLIAKIPGVTKGAKALKSLGGIEKVAAKYPRLYSKVSKGLGAFTKGATVGAITATPEALGEQLPTGEALKHISKQAALLGGVAASFQLASTVDTAIYTKRLRNALVRASNQRFSAKIGEIQTTIPQGPGRTAALQSLESLKRIELQNIDGIVSAAEAQLIGLKTNKMYQRGQEMVETPQKAAERFIKLGYLSTRPYPKGEPSLKRGLGKPKPFIKMPTTRMGEAKEAMVEAMKVARHPIIAARKATMPTEVTPISVPKEPTPAKIVPVKPGLDRIAEELLEAKAAREAIEKIAPPTEAIPAPERPVRARKEPEAVEVAPEMKLPAKITSGYPPTEFEFTGRWSTQERKARHIPMPTVKGQIRKARKFKVPIYRSAEGKEILYMEGAIETPETPLAKPPTVAKAEPTKRTDIAEYLKLKEDFSSMKFNIGSPQAKKLQSIERTLIDAGILKTEETYKAPSDLKEKMISRLEEAEPTKVGKITKEELQEIRKKGRKLRHGEEIKAGDIGFVQPGAKPFRPTIGRKYDSRTDHPIYRVKAEPTKVVEPSKDSYDIFATNLERKGAARTPKGIEYKLVQPDAIYKPNEYAVERVIEGERETIVGMRGEKFESRAQAMSWARSDAKKRDAEFKGAEEKALKEIREKPTEPQKQAEKIEKKIPEVEVEKKPGPAKTLESIREEGKKKADITVVMPSEKPSRVIEPAKGKKRVAVSLEDKTELFKFTDFGTGIGQKGKVLYHIATQKQLASFDNAKEARKAATSLAKDFAVDWKNKDIEKVKEDFNFYIRAKGITDVKGYLTGKGKELEVEDYIKSFSGIALKKIDYNLDKAIKTIAARLKDFAIEVPEFTLNPTFTFEKESGQLVFKDRYRFGFYPDRLGFLAEDLEDGQTIRFDLESFGIKPAAKKALEPSKAFLGEPKILGRIAKKPIPVEKFVPSKKPPYTQRKISKAEEAYEKALVDIEIGERVEVPGGVTYKTVTEKEIRRVAELGKKAGRQGWTVERDILLKQERGTADTKVAIRDAIKIIRNVFGKKIAKPSKVGFPARLATEEMPTAMEYLAKEPVSAREIITHLSKSLKVPYASMATHRRRTAAGFYEVRPVGIRQVNIRDLGTATHEVGHHIDYFWKIRRAGISKIGRRTWKMPEGTAKGTAAELTKLGKMLYGEKKPKGGYKGEGIAEFVRGYLTEHIDIRKEAPHFYKWFVEDYLPSNPEIANALHNAKAMLTEYRLQGAEARIESQISRKEINATIANRAKMANLWMQEMFVDEFAPLRVGMEEAGIERDKLRPSEDPYELAVFFSQKEGARARQMVLFGTIDLWGNKTGKGLKEIMKPISDQNAVREFTHWIVSARSLDLWKRGINPGVSKKDAQYVYDLYKGNEGWKETAKEITDWNHRVLDYLVQGGALQKDVADKMVKLNPIYVPFMRAFAKGEKRFGGGGAGRGLITTKKGVFSIKGSGREIIDPFESMITQTRRMISIAHKSVIARALAKLETKYRGLAGFIWKVPAPKRATTFQAEQVKKQLMKMGVEFPEAGLEKMDALLTVYGNSPIYFGKDNIICIVENGKRNWYEVSPEMYHLLQGLDKFYLPRFLNITLGKAARSVRLGATGINASFGLVANPIRDSLDTIFKGTHARGPGATIMGVAKDLSRLGLAKSLGIEPSKAAQEFVAMGGQISGFVGQDRKSLQHLRGEMLASSVGKYSIHTVNHPIDALREVFGIAESGPRIQEYKKALEVGEKKYGKGSPDAKVYAFNKAQDQTINYSRHGVLGKWLNQMIPFWNANMQDISKVHRTFRTRGKQATAYAVAFLTLPALGLWWYNKDEEWYKELLAFEKANYLHVRLPGKYKCLRIPVPFLVGHIFQGFPVVICDALYRADKTKVTQFFEQVLKGDVYPLTEWPAIVSPVIDVLQNKDWAGRPIVPRGVEGKLPSDQYKKYTTEFCKVIGKIFNYSPAKIEHLLNSWSGGLYRRTGAMTEKLLGLKKTEMQPADWPVIGRLFVRDPYAPKASIEKFYKEKERLNQMYQSRKIAPGSDLDKKRKRYNSINTKYLSPRWKALTKTKTIKQRERIYKEIGALVKVK